MNRLAIAALAMAVGPTTGCFSTFDEFRQLALPVRPPGARDIPPGPPPDVFPLVRGSRYDYAARFGLGGGQFTGEAVVSVIDAWQIDQRRTAHVSVVASYFGRTQRDPFVFVHDPGWIGLFEKFPPDRITYFLPTTLSAGRHWPVETGEGTGEAWVEAEEPVEVPAGKFPVTQRVRYLNPGAHTDLTLWLAPHIGLVKARVRIPVAFLPLEGLLELKNFYRSGNVRMAPMSLRAVSSVGSRAKARFR